MPAVHLQQMSEVTISVDRAWHLWECPASAKNSTRDETAKVELARVVEFSVLSFVMSYDYELNVGSQYFSISSGFFIN